MTLGSLFDGIGGWLIAAKNAGVKPIWASEIDPFPASVTANHFPDVRQWGDITKIDPATLEPVDIICAGSPCQDLSVAGKRAGLEGERSGLFHTAIRLVHDLRRRTGKPRFFVWENVPGAFSSNKGLDFKAVIEEIIEAEIPMPEGGKWAEAGYVEWGGASSLAWRTLDAQYWGVPQRRKRIFLVADFGSRAAGEILFIEQSLPGDTQEGQGKGECAAEEIRGGLDGAVIRIYDTEHADEVVREMKGGKVHALRARMGTGGGNAPMVHSYCIAGNTIDRQPKNGGNHLGANKDVSFTLNTADRHAVCVGNGQLHQVELSDKVGALNTMHDQQCVMYRQGGFAGMNTVRRLTPLECERLQGLPDGYTNVDFQGKPAPDSRRYKAIGNGMTQPCADFVIRRIVENANS